MKTTAIPVVIGALGTIKNKLINYLKLIGVNISFETTRKSALLGSGFILRIAGKKLRKLDFDYPRLFKKDSYQIYNQFSREKAQNDNNNDSNKRHKSQMWILCE